MTQILVGQGLIFEVVSASISEASTEGKPFVVYTVQIRHVAGSDDINPSVITRRYTDFLNLYTALRKTNPEVIGSVVFPKKVLIGNFDNALISTRSTEFQNFLRYVSCDPKLRASTALLHFLQDPEMAKAKALMAQNDYKAALELLENIFKLLNKVFTDRSPGVIIALCRLLGCALEIPNYKETVKWANLAVHRYHGVSDSDLLQLYVPLLKTCRLALADDSLALLVEQRLNDLRRQGISITKETVFLEEIDQIEKKIFA